MMNRMVPVVVFIFILLTPIMAKTDSLSLYFKQKQANKFLQQGDTAAALEAYSDVLQTVPDHAETLYNLGVLYYQNGQFDEADKSFKNALSVDSNIREDIVNYALGNVAFNKGDYKRAVEHYKYVVLLDPENRNAKINLELALEALKNQSQQNDDQEQENEQENEQEEEQSEDDIEEEEQDQQDEEETEEDEQEEEQEEPEIEEEPQDDQLENLLNSLDQLEKEARDQFLNQNLDHESEIENDW